MNIQNQLNVLIENKTIALFENATRSLAVDTEKFIVSINNNEIYDFYLNEDNTTIFVNFVDDYEDIVNTFNLLDEIQIDVFELEI